MRRLEVFWHKGGDLKKEEKVPIGILAQKRGPQIVFEWDKSFLLNQIELSPITFKKVPGLIQMKLLPFDGLHGFFADSVPDGFGRLLLREALKGEGINFDDVSPLDYLQLVGMRGMGALSFEPALKRGKEWAEGKIDLDKLEKGAKSILAGSKLSGTASSVLDAFLSGGASPNGARPKILAKEKDGKLYVGDEALKASEWLIKFRAPEDSKDQGILEYIYSLMARRAGLKVPETKLFTTKKGSFFASKRFDRDEAGSRIHMHTVSGLLNASPINFSVGYDHFAKLAGALTKDRRNIEQVFRLSVFNVLSFNQDDHTKNAAFLMDENGKWRVAPAYDLTFHRNSSGQHKMGVMGKGAPTESDLKEFGKEIGISKKAVSQILEEVKESLLTFPKLASEFGLGKFERDRVKKALPLQPTHRPLGS
jgi:serine/threonine-protein kinase HipA